MQLMRKRVNVRKRLCISVSDRNLSRNLKLIGIKIESRIIVIEDTTSTRKRNTKNMQKHPKRLYLVTNKHPEN